jgi:hypothetical protein
VRSAEAAAFVERFAEIWSEPTAERYKDLWHSDGKLLHPTMREPLPQERIGDYVSRLQSVVPDVVLRVERWASSDDTVFIEWVLSGTFRGQRQEISGVDRFTLRGDRAVEGVAWFDTMPLWAQIDPEMDRGEIIEALTTPNATD